MSKTQIYWLLIIIPAILLAIAASCLLLEQQIKVKKIEREVDRQLAVHRSEAIQFFIDSVKSELETAVRTSLADKDGLMELERTDPRVRSTAIWSKTHGFVYPDFNSALEEAPNLLQRYAPIITDDFAERRNAPVPDEDLQEQSLVRTVAKSAENFSQRNFGQMDDVAIKGEKVLVTTTKEYNFSSIFGSFRFKFQTRTPHVADIAPAEEALRGLKQMAMAAADFADGGNQSAERETNLVACAAEAECDEAPSPSELAASVPEPQTGDQQTSDLKLQTTNDTVLGGSLIARNEPRGRARRSPVPESAATETKKKSPAPPAKVRSEPLPAAAPDGASSHAKLAASTPESQTSAPEPQTSNLKPQTSNLKLQTLLTGKPSLSTVSSPSSAERTSTTTTSRSLTSKPPIFSRRFPASSIRSLSGAMSSRLRTGAANFS